MKLNHVQHIAVNTNDIDESIAFYRDILGLDVTHKADMGEFILVYVLVNGDSYIELFDQKGKTTDGTCPEVQAGLRHIAFDVDDVRAWNNFLKEKNVPFAAELVEMPQIGKRAILVKDPNGVVIELCENLLG